MTVKSVSTIESRKYNPDFQICVFILQMATTTEIHRGMLMMGLVDLPTQATIMNSEVLSNSD